MCMRAMEGRVGEMAVTEVTERVSLKVILITLDYIICLYVFVDFVFHPGLTYSVRCVIFMSVKFAKRILYLG